MSAIEWTNNEAIGDGIGGITNIDVPPNASFKLYYADRSTPSDRLRAAESVMDVSVTVAHPVKKVWPIFKEFDLWQSRFGYHWTGTPADNEDKIVSLVNKGDANDYKYGKAGAQPRYVVRKVIPEQLIYFDALPSPLVGIAGVWTGHNVVNLREEQGNTKIAFFMEHTMYSETASRDALRAELQQAIANVIAFWRDFFIADLNAVVESRLGSAPRRGK